MQIIQDYRTLHKIPEPDNRLPKTLCWVRSRLSFLKCRCFSPIPGALCAFFDFGGDHALAFRADLDALPLTEQTGLSWASRHPGYMHACGHDGHTAILLELARKLHQTPKLGCNILLIFQPSEETEGGAQPICNTAILQEYGVSAIFGLHLWPGLPAGHIFSRSGPLMANSGSITARFFGKSVHIANFKQGVDSLYACIQFYQATQKLSFPGILKFGKLTGGTAGNILCDEAVLCGSLRTLKDQTAIRQKLQQLMERISRATGCTGKLTISPGYPAVFNHPELFNRVQKCCPVEVLKQTFWTCDDFSFYQKNVPGLYFLLGVGDTPPLHSPQFQFDPALLTCGADYFYRLCTKLA